jgi:hypothetical protein
LSESKFSGDRVELKFFLCASRSASRLCVKSSGAEEFHKRRKEERKAQRRISDLQFVLDWHRVDAAGLSEKLAKER